MIKYMKKLLVKLFYGDPVKTARIVLSLTLLNSIVIALSKNVWNIFSISITTLIILSMISSIYVSLIKNK